MCSNSLIYQTAPSGSCWSPGQIFTQLSFSRPLPFPRSDTNATPVPLCPQKFNNAAVLMCLFALFPWARWLLASLNIGWDNLWISISLFSSISARGRAPLCTQLPSLIHFAFWSRSSSAAVILVEDDGQRQFALSSRPCPTSPVVKIWTLFKEAAVVWHSQWQVLYKHLGWLYSCLSPPGRDAVTASQRSVCDELKMSEEMHLIFSLWPVKAPLICACGFSLPCEMYLAPC